MPVQPTLYFEPGVVFHSYNATEVHNCYFPNSLIHEFYQKARLENKGVHPVYSVVREHMNIQIRRRLTIRIFELPCNIEHSFLSLPKQQTSNAYINSL